ncbi:MAG: WecB/TagA/CpsF family glycosyltransferase [Pseudomonadales bacterium]|nr:WecB/TagA/CpsF family glycosyltransferase [Pseudomonadales bacterium]
MLERKKIITMEVDITSHEKAIQKIQRWIGTKRGYYTCVSNVHMCIETFNNKKFRKIVNGADLVVPDGRPIYWAQKLLGLKEAQQVRGMDLTFSLCRYAEQNNIKIGFYGSSESTLNTLQKNLKNDYPNINIAFAISPPYRELSPEEKSSTINEINNSEIDILFVGLGCPKQESWMAEHKNQLNCVMLGVGAAFDFIAGNKKHAPVIMQRLGIEWIFRLLSEPKRLWRRYLSTNPKFIGLFLLQLCGYKFPG